MQYSDIQKTFGNENAKVLVAHFEQMPKATLVELVLKKLELVDVCDLVWELSCLKDKPLEEEVASWVAVDSTNIEAIRYFKTEKRLDIRFKSSAGNFYSYEAVPNILYEYFQDAESKGGFFAGYIKGRFTCTKSTMAH